MELFDFVETQFLNWGMLISRITGMFIITPLLSGRFIPTTVKVFLVLSLSYMMLPQTNSIPLNTPVIHIVLSLTNNFIVGFAMGLMAFMILGAFSIAGELLGVESGFGLATSMDPTMEESPIIGQFVFLLAIFVFISLNGHLVVYEAILDSIKIFPLDLDFLDFNFTKFITTKFVEMFFIALKIGLPVIGYMFIINVLLGILSRLVPQMNVFMVGIPLKSLLVFLIFLGMVPLWAETSAKLTILLEKTLEHFLSG
ncbi:flagellar biosynthesis protein FliR [Thermosipho melanesiensis]|uniref:Flagellar biosynthetic protein FliR n=2 Tax=Thermosipho melanesiensis TaxID=46541 RepID=A6LLB0_THEM4|nr:flagellar biosynthetic protein FliR [Thermosipho melanesiensis]ABR30711.1 flagellar biosynthetic protein FliR [Thermosipho melanesiensis BI429]APT73840.1 flagellar biosynthesis protein FliR [Thermosipho melanesiensis]OOC35780.1 flagellar biosynthesis protein FliR [Thermosipho melanesiensis]OOC39079.1 flagellar biosynthesis protein FliR [Thermosipho melanesiensis]OOC39227.1 flagellar biosynthesis protein FliR [Thermosipho melanesiensis]